MLRHDYALFLSLCILHVGHIVAYLQLEGWKRPLFSSLAYSPMIWACSSEVGDLDLNFLRALYLDLPFSRLVL